MFERKARIPGFLLLILTPLFLVTVLFAQASDTLFMPYDPDMESLVDVDAVIDEDEYPESFYNEPTLITVYWGCDDSLVYVGMKAPVCAWLSMGFGSAKREGSNIIIGRISEDSTDIENYLGTKEGYKLIKEDRIVDWDIDEDEDTVVFEFVYPMSFPAESGLVVKKLEHGKVYDFNLGFSKAFTPKTKQERRSFGTFMIEQKKAVEETPAPEESMPQPVKKGTKTK